MREPSEKELNKRLKKYYKLIANIQSSCVLHIADVRKHVYSQLGNLASGDIGTFKALEAYVLEKYNEMFLGLKNDITDVYKNAYTIETNFVNVTAGMVIVNKTSELIKALPNTEAFKITNRILSEKSILKRNKILANRVTTIIADSFEKDLSIQNIQRKLDIELGFRNKKGIITDKSKALIQSGKFSHRNGHIYQTYRIARTETMRMANLRTYEVFEEIQRDDKRLKLMSTIDARTRWQSIAMNGQVSNNNGKFKYPDGKYYRLGEQPPQWSINDRETSYVIFLENESKTNN